MPSLEIVGGWPHAGLVMRLLEVVDSPWRVGRAGLVERRTRALCTVEMRFTDLRLPARIREGQSRVAPTLLESDWDDIDDHRSVLRVLPAATARRQAAGDAMRCGAALVNAGGVAVLTESGASHRGEHWVALAERHAAATTPEAALAPLVEGWVQPLVAVGSAWGTRGMAILDLPELEVHGVDEATALAVLERSTAALCAGKIPTDGGVLEVAGKGFVARVSEPGPLPAKVELHRR